MSSWLSLVTWLCLAAVVSGGPGTTPNIRELFMGRCYDYKQIRYYDVLPQVAASCGQLWDAFLSGFAYKDPCSLETTDYAPFMNAARQTLPDNKAIFWSGVKDLVHELAQGGQRYAALEDTLVGYLVDGLTWCGNKSGIDFRQCPGWNDCPRENTEAFWGAASTTFAQSARGTSITVVLDATRSDAYRPASFFGRYELPNLNTNYIKTVRVVLVTPLNRSPAVTCRTGSMDQMKRDVKAKGLDFVCDEDDKAVRHMLCVGNPSDRKCKMRRSASPSLIRLK